MAKKNITNHYTVVRQEGAAGATRGKISAAMAQEMGAKDGRVIEWELQNGDVVGARVLDAKESRQYLKEHTRGSAPAKATAKKTTTKSKGKKSVAKQSEDEAPRKTLKKSGKSNKRATKVSYEEPKKKGGKKSKPVLKKR